MSRKISIEIIAFLFILLFMYAGWSKLLDYQKFKIQIGQSPLLTGFGDSIPWMVIALEFIISFCFVFTRLRLIAFIASFSLMTMFSAYIIAILNFTSYVPCSCGGVLEKLGWTEHLVFNFSFVLLAFGGALLQEKEVKEEKSKAHFNTAEAI